MRSWGRLLVPCPSPPDSVSLGACRTNRLPNLASMVLSASSEIPFIRAAFLQFSFSVFAAESKYHLPPSGSHSILEFLPNTDDVSSITDSLGRPVRISKTHAFRHTRATNLLNAGVPLHVVMRHFGHVTPTMTMHYAKTLSETAEREFLRYKKVTADGRALDVDPSDLYDVLSLDQRADRILPNGWCLLPPKQVWTKGNACLTCDKFVTDAIYTDDLRQQLDKSEALIESRKSVFLARYGSPMPEDNVWLRGRQEERGALRKILSTIERSDENPGSAVRGAGTADRPDPEEKDARA